MELKPTHVYKTTDSRILPPSARKTAVIYRQPVSTPSGEMASVVLLKSGASLLIPASQIVRF